MAGLRRLPAPPSRSPSEVALAFPAAAAAIEAAAEGVDAVPAGAAAPSVEPVGLLPGDVEDDE